MVGITIIKESDSSAIPHLSTKIFSKKPRKMNATSLIIIILGLIGIIFGFMFLSLYIKTSCELDSLKKLIKSQESMSTTTSTTTATTTTNEKEEFRPESCDDVDDVLSWLKCEKSVERENARVREEADNKFNIRVRENRKQSDWTSKRNFIIFIIFFVALFPAIYLFLRVYLFCKNR